MNSSENRRHSLVNLHNIPSLQHLETGILRAIAEEARLYRLETQQVLFYQGDLSYSLYIVQEGTIRLVEYTPDGQNVTLKIYGPGEIFGLLAISGPYPYPSQAEALQESLVIELRGQAARRLIETYPALALTFIDLLVKHVHAAHDRLLQMAVERVEVRLARALLHLGEKFVSPGGLQTTIDIPLSQKDLAEFVGTTVETINRTLKIWEEQGIIQRSRRHVAILNSQALIDLLEDHILQT